MNTIYPYEFLCYWACGKNIRSHCISPYLDTCNHARWSPCVIVETRNLVARITVPWWQASLCQCSYDNIEGRGLRPRASIPLMSEPLKYDWLFRKTKWVTHIVIGPWGSCFLNVSTYNCHLQMNDAEVGSFASCKLPLAHQHHISHLHVNSISESSRETFAQSAWK